MMRKRKLIILDNDTEEKNMHCYLALACDHLGLSRLFKPSLSVIFDVKELVSQKEEEAIQKKCMESGENQYIKVHVISDGRKAYIKRI